MDIYLLAHGLAIKSTNKHVTAPVSFYCSVGKLYDSPNIKLDVASDTGISETYEPSDKQVQYEHLLIGGIDVFTKDLPEYVENIKKGKDWVKHTTVKIEGYGFTVCIDNENKKAYIIPRDYRTAFALSWLIDKISKLDRFKGCTLRFHWLACRSFITKEQIREGDFGKLIEIEKVVGVPDLE